MYMEYEGRNLGKLYCEAEAIEQVILYNGYLRFCPKKRKKLSINLSIHSVIFNKIIAIVSLKSNDKRV